MFSIVTSIHNQLEINKLFYESLSKYTKNLFELIIIDNASNDGSTEYFKSKKEVVLIRNEFNYNYPFCQNQGLAVAKYDTVCFFNNDIIVSPSWDEKVLTFNKMHPEVMVFSVATNDHLESKNAQQKINKKWKKIKYILKFLLGVNSTSLKIMLKLTYGNFENYCKQRFALWGLKYIEGYSGSAIILKKEAINKIGVWDERIQAADFDIFNRVKKRSIQYKDIAPIQLILGIYFHHFQRMTLKSNHAQFYNKDEIISIDEKWGTETKMLRKDIIG